MTLRVDNPFPTFVDNDGRPITGGQMWLGVEGEDPELDPINAFFDEALTIPAPQPIDITAGLLTNAGNPTWVYVDENQYSIRVRDAAGAEVIYKAEAVEAVDATLPLQAVNRAAMQAFTDMAAGQQASLSEAGREGVFVWSTANNATNVTGDPAQAIYVPPASDTDGSSGAWVRRYVPGHYQATWWGVKADGATDDTVAIQRGWNWVGANGGGRIEYPAGTMVVGGALTDTSFSNAQLVLPQIEDATEVISLRLTGAGSPATGNVETGTIFKGTLAAGNGAMIGCKTDSEGEGAAGRTYVSLTIDPNITLRTPLSCGITALDLSYVPWSKIGCRVDKPDMVDSANVFDFAEPTDVDSYGIRAPLPNVAARCYFDHCVIAGYRVGVRFNELCSGYLTIAACPYPMVIDTPGVSNPIHPTTNLNVLVTCCPRGIFCDGPVEVHMFLDMEHSDAEAQGPSWVEPRGYDIDDASNLLRGEIFYHMHDYADPFTVNGGKKANIQQVDVIPSLSNRTTFPIYDPATFDAVTNRSSVLETRGRWNGAPYHNLIGNRASGSGLVGAITVANGLAAGPEYRLMQFAVGTDGEADRGTATIAVARDGVMNDAIGIESHGFVTLPSIPNVADDAAAATAGVPSKGLWRRSADGVLMQRA